MDTLLLKEQLFQKSFEYVRGIIGLHELEEWLLPNFEDILDSGDASSREIAQLIEGGAIEVQAGLYSEAELSEELRNLLFASTVRSSGTRAMEDTEAPDPHDTIRWDSQVSSSESGRSR
ncbi:MAG: hypothetical protein OXR07_01450 [Nitrospira sp.]|nr:hypothetical protein [Nitrospira sp.]